MKLAFEDWDQCISALFLMSSFTRFWLCSCGCPSEKVAGHGCFGASLMLESGVRC